MSYAEKLKMNSGKNLKALQERMNKENSKKTYENQENPDEMWKPTRDKAGNSVSLIRFLPPHEGEDKEWVKFTNHFFKIDGRYYIENSLLNLDKADPVNEKFSELWNAGKKDEAKRLSRRENYVSNILVIKDTGNPENNGKIFKYNYGITVFNMINDRMNGDEINEGVDIFDPFVGCNLLLKGNQKGEGNSQYTEYVNSSWQNSSPITEDLEELDKVMAKTFSLEEYLSPEKHKDYDTLKKRLDFVLNGKDNKSKEDVMKEAVEESKKYDTLSDDNDPPWDEGNLDKTDSSADTTDIDDLNLDDIDMDDIDLERDDTPL